MLYLKQYRCILDRVPTRKKSALCKDSKHSINLSSITAPAPSPRRSGRGRSRRRRRGRHPSPSPRDAAPGRGPARRPPAAAAPQHAEQAARLRDPHEQAEAEEPQLSPAVAEQVPLPRQEDRRHQPRHLPGHLRHLQPRLLVLLPIAGGAE